MKSAFNSDKTEQYIIEVERDEVTKLPRSMITTLNGKFHSPPDDRPAHVLFDEQGRPREMRWFHEDHPHRTSGPAWMKINPENGVVTYEEYRHFGAAHRSLTEPAVTERDPSTGEVLREMFFLNDRSINPKLVAKLHLKR